MIIVNGRVVAQGSQFSLNDMETVVATVDLEDVRSYRSQKSRALQATKQPAYERIEVNFSLSADSEDVDPRIKPSPEIEVKYHLPEEEIAYGPAVRFLHHETFFQLSNLPTASTDHENSAGYGTT